MAAEVFSSLLYLIYKKTHCTVDKNRLVTFKLFDQIDNETMFNSS